jgi:SecD/SecF fusion protein
LCILLDGVAFSAPNLRSAIRVRGTIEGDFSETEQDGMVNKLNAGSFPARLSEVPISEKSIGPAIGKANAKKGITAGLIGLAAVVVFMMIYYLAAGAIADIALLLNILFVLGMMAMLRATFTLPGIAGLILTIGMSVDANVLIFERIREEQDRGSSLKTAIANGYQRAFWTIFDANLTTFFVALILNVVASEEIKGFAIVLMLGIAASMFTALFVTRVFFAFLVGRGIMKDHLRMVRLIRKPNIDWMGLRKVFFTISILLIAGGMFVFFTRDEATNNKYDIEFTGGTSVQIKLKPEFKDLTQADIKELFKGVAQGISRELEAAKVYSVGDEGLEYEISTTETNKTTATVTFSAAGKTVESVTAAIEAAMEDFTGTLYNLQVSTEDDTLFTVSTSQVNKALVANVLNAAFAAEGTVSEPNVDEIVSRAVREAFTGKLDVREDLGVTIVSVDKIAEDSVELLDYLGGIKITVNLRTPATEKEIDERLKEIGFKADAQDLAHYRHAVLSSNLGALNPGESVTSFVYVSVHPEAGYRDLDASDWDNYIENEKQKITRACSLKTTLSRVTQIDPSIGEQAKNRAIAAIVLSLIVIVAYIWMRFGTAIYGFAAIAALVHDVCITLGAVTVCTYLVGTPVGNLLKLGDFKINLQMIAAFLTIIGYSLNDTIVVFDRIRENRGKLSMLNPQIVSNSINQTLSRTLLTSFTTFLVVLVMYIWGGPGLRGFTFAMLIGIIVGTYSSIAIATPILLLGSKRTSSKLHK